MGKEKTRIWKARKADSQLYEDVECIANIAAVLVVWYYDTKILVLVLLVIVVVILILLWVMELSITLMLYLD